MKSASFNTGFNVDTENKDPGAAPAPASDPAAGSEPEVDPISSAAALHVCEYLSTETAKALLEKLSLPISVLEPPKGNKRKSWEHHDGEQEKLLEYTRGGNGGEDGAEKKKVSTQPAAARALKKRFVPCAHCSRVHCRYSGLVSPSLSLRSLRLFRPPSQGASFLRLFQPTTPSPLNPPPPISTAAAQGRHEERTGQQKGG